MRSTLCLNKREGKIRFCVCHHTIYLLLVTAFPDVICVRPCSFEEAKKHLKAWSTENNKHKKIEKPQKTREAKPAPKRKRKGDEDDIIKA